MKFRQPASFHCHLGSLDTGSPIESFVKREKELGSTSLCCTDHGHLQSLRVGKRLAKEAGLTFCGGLEGYLRDDFCPILESHGILKNAKGTYADYNKYYHFTVHFKDYEAFTACSKLISKRDLTAEVHGSERKPIFSWKDLAELCSHNVTLGSGCLIGIAQRHLMNERLDIAEEYYKKARSLVKPGDFYAEVFPHVCDFKYTQGIFFTFEDGHEVRFWAKKKLKTDKGEFTAEDIARYPNKHKELLAVKNYTKWDEVKYAPIKEVKSVDDFIKNESTDLAPDGDLQLPANKFIIEMAHKYGDKIIPSMDAHFAYPDEKIVQDVKLTNGATGQTWKFKNSYHIIPSDEMFEYFNTYLGIDEKTYNEWVDNSLEWADKFKGFEFQNVVSLPTRFYPEDTLGHLKKLIDAHGRMDWSNKVYADRLKQEIELLRYNGTIDLLPYFFLMEDIISYSKKNKQLVGPGRGSSAGVLTAYLLEITDVDPIRFSLSLDRFITLDRIKSGKLPDIDTDFSNRDAVIDGLLIKKFGEYFSPISTNLTFKLKSAIKDANRALNGEVSRTINEICGRLPQTPQGLDDRKFALGYEDTDGHRIPGLIDTSNAFKEYVRGYPKEWAMVQKMLSVTKGKGTHASAYVIANSPIGDFIPMTTVTDTRATSWIDDDVEEAGGIKVDLLSVNSLTDIQSCLEIIHKTNNTPELDYNEIKFDGQVYKVWGLPSDEKVFADIINGRTETVFQMDTNAAANGLTTFKKYSTNGNLINNIERIADFIALDRPGPLDAFVECEGKTHNMLEEYARRLAGLEPAGNNITLDILLPKTKGILIFQESLTAVYKHFTGCTGAEAEEFRSIAAKKKMEKMLKMKPSFIKAASKKVPVEEAEEIWNTLNVWSSYGFNLSHAVSYAHVTYASAFLKHHFPLEWWTAVLKNAKKDEIVEKFWPYCGTKVAIPDINLSGDEFDIQDGKIRAPINLLMGVGPAAHKEICENRPYKDLKDFCLKVKEHKGSARASINKGTVNKLIVGGVLDSLYPKDTPLIEKFTMYNTYMAEVLNKKNVEPIDESLINMDRVKLYQYRKSILPIYAEDITESVAIRGGPINKDFNGKYNLDRVPLVNSNELDQLIALTIIPNGGLNVAVAGYVVSERRFKFHTDKEAAALSVDVGGKIHEFVKWPEKNGKLRGIPKEDLTGNVILVVLNRWRESRPFVASKIFIVEPAI